MIKNLEERIKFVLSKHPETKDNDPMLTSLIWFYDLGRDKIKKMSAWELMTMLSKGKLINPRSIRRCRCKIQEQNAEFRGEKYKERHRLELEVKNEIKNWTGKLF